jgi:hypothetical protein
MPRLTEFAAQVQIMVLLASLLMCLFWFGPAGALLLLALILEQRRLAPNGTKPQGNILLRCLVGGIIAAIVWAILVALLIATTGSGNAGLWIVFTPWAFALGEGAALVRRQTSSG